MTTTASTQPGWSAMRQGAVAMWRTGRFDTVAIATRTGLSEGEVCKLIHADRERRRSGQ